jgi:uncharacterized protein
MLEEVEFESNGVTLRGRFIVPRNDKDKSPLVIMVTGDGLSGSKSSTWSVFFEAFAEAGIPAFIFDFAGLGYSEGTTAELTLTIGRSNMMSAVQWVKQQRWIDSGRIGMLGSSFGGSVVLLHAGEHDDAKVLALKSPVSYLPEVHETDLGPDGMAAWKRNDYSDHYGFNYSMYLDGFNHNIYGTARNIKAPCLIVHGDADTVVPIDQSKRLAQSLTGEKILHVLPGVNHDYKQGDAQKVMTSLIVNWFRDKL